MIQRFPSTDAETLISLLDLSPHPEGGFFRETFRDRFTLSSQQSASTAIYFLVLENHPTRWHKISSSEVWHWYGGSPLELCCAAPHQPSTNILMGFDIEKNMFPQHSVPAGWWQKASTLGPWSLVGCTVAPGFHFEDLVFAPHNSTPPFFD